MDLFKKESMSETKLIMGGVIPPVDVETLNQIGVHAIFTPGTRREALLNKIGSIL